MKKLLLLAALLPGLATAQPAPPVEATTTQVGAGTLGFPFVVTPRGLLGFSPIYTNIAASTLTNVAQSISDTSSNLVWQNIYFTKTNLFSGNAFALGTNKTYVGSSAVNLSSIVGAQAANYSVGELSLIASGGDITITNPVSWNTNTSWTVTSGHRAECAMKVQLGLFTNFVVYVQ